MTIFDAHLHIVDARFPLVANQRYLTAPFSTADDRRQTADGIGGAAVFWLDWNWVDPVLTLVIAGYILLMSFGLLRRTSVILMEGTPAGLSIETVKQAVEAIDGVLDMHHIHIWELDEHRRALEAHIVLERLSRLLCLTTAEVDGCQHAPRRLSLQGGSCRIMRMNTLRHPPRPPWFWRQ